MNSQDLLTAARHGVLRYLLLVVRPGTRLTDRPDITLLPDDGDEHGDHAVFARRQLTAPGPWTALTWSPLLGANRSRLSLDDQAFSYGNGL